MKHKFFKATDMLVIVAVLFSALIIFILALPKEDRGSKVEISVDNKVVQILPLNEDDIYEAENGYGYNRVVVKNGQCFVEMADCRDNICVSHSPIYKVGETIVCLPHRLIAEVK